MLPQIKMELRFRISVRETLSFMNDFCHFSKFNENPTDQTILTRNKLMCPRITLLQLISSGTSKASLDVLATCHFAQRDQIFARCRHNIMSHHIEKLLEKILRQFSRHEVGQVIKHCHDLSLVSGFTRKKVR